MIKRNACALLCESVRLLSCDCSGLNPNLMHYHSQAAPQVPHRLRRCEIRRKRSSDIVMPRFAPHNAELIPDTDRTYVDSTGGGRGATEPRADGAACNVALRRSPVGQLVDSRPSVGIMLSNNSDRKIEQSQFLESCMLSRGWERIRAPYSGRNGSTDNVR
jgi:hypothetical protein